MYIKEAAEITGFSRDTIRYYEKLGLLKPKTNKDSGYRKFSANEISILKFIKNSKGLGFTLSEIKEMIKTYRNKNHYCDETIDFTNAKIKDIEDKIKQLNRFKKNLANLIDSCEDNVPGNLCLAFEELWK